WLCCEALGGVGHPLGQTCVGEEACCFPDGSCMQLDPLCCIGEGGAPQGPGTVCTGPTACCLPNGDCVMLDWLCCEELDGTPHPVGQTCSDDEEACCLPDGSCVQRDPLCCIGEGTAPQGPGSQCSGMEACCLPDNTCVMADPLCCVNELGGVPQGPQWGCLGMEACCLPDGTCVMADAICCMNDFGGVPQGPGSQCGGMEACCLPDGSCIMADALCCINELGGNPQGPGTVCTAPEGCCFPDESCSDLDPLCCIDQGGTPQGPGSQCGGWEACCLPDGSCQMADALCCVNELGGVPQGPGTVCTTPEACCFPNGSCMNLDPLCCTAQGGFPSPSGTPACLGDFNGNGFDDACDLDSDGDGIPDLVEIPGDRDGDNYDNHLDYDPTGYFYNEVNGEIIPGGKVSVTGPGVITLYENGSSGYYRFLTDGTAGLYTIALTLPPSTALSTTCLPQGILDPSGGPNPYVLGKGEIGSTGFLEDNSCNPYYLIFDLEPGDPFIINNNFPLRIAPALSWGDTCINHVGPDDAEDFLMGSGPGFADQDTYAVGFYNPKGEAMLTSISFQWFDPGAVNLWVYLGSKEECPYCGALDPGRSPLGTLLGEVGSGEFIGNWEWELVEVNETCIQIPAKSCFYIVWMMPAGQNRPRIFGDYGHAMSHSWIYNAEMGQWKCFPGYEYMVEVCLEYQPECLEIHEPDITWSHPYRGEYLCVCDDYTVYATFHSGCNEPQSALLEYWDLPWGLFTVPDIGREPLCSHWIEVPPKGTVLDSCACEFHHHPDMHNWWARNIGIAWDRDMDLCYEDPDPPLYFTRRCRLTIWPDGPWGKEPIRWGLAPITIPVYNEHADPMRFELRVTDVPESWRAALSWTDRTLSPGATENVILTVWPGGEEPEGPVVIKVRAFKCNGEWGYVEIEFLPYPEHVYLGPDGRPIQPVHVEDIRWSPRYPCENTAYDVWATVVNDGPNSAYPKISFGLAEWGFFTPPFEGMVYDTVLWGGIGGRGRQVVAPYHYQMSWFEYEDLGCNYYQQYARNIVIDYPVMRRHCLTPEMELGVWTGDWVWTAEDSTTEYVRDCEMWFWPKHRWVDADSTWRPVVFPIPLYNEEPYYDNIDLWIDENAFPPHIPPGWDYAFDVDEFDLLPGESAVANLTVIPRGSAPPLDLPAHVIVQAAKGYCKRDTDYVDIKFLPFTGMCIRDTSGIKVGYKYSETCSGDNSILPTLLPGDQVGIGLMLDNEYPVSAAQIDLWYESAYMRVVDVQTTTRTTGFELVHRELAPGTHEIALYSTPTHPIIVPNPPSSHCELPPGYSDVGLLSIVTVTFEILPGAPAGECADIWYGTVILDGLPDWEGHPKEPLCLKFEDKGQ
ncbi:MAG: thrombospondin type 3 repeat-containing protein, partial [Gemmatimonadota bacterium]